MKEYFDREIVRQAELHCISKYPEEACGFILENSFEPMENIAEDKVMNFQIKQENFLKYQDKIKCIIHSHADYPHLSKHDMEMQIKSGKPWGLVLLNHSKVEHTVFWGKQLEPQDLLERPFIHGIYDCYAIVRDYWRLKGHDVMDFPRDNLWWEKYPSMLEDGCNEAGFDFIDESKVKEGDVIFMKIMAPVVNHSAIYLGDGLILHHLYNRLSRKEPLHRWRKFVTGYLRYRYA